MKHAVRISTVAVASMALMLSACGAPPPDSPVAEGENKHVKACIVSDTAGFNDRSFNQSAMEGVRRAVKELGVSWAAVESKSSAEFKPNYDNLIAQRCTVIFGVSYTANDSLLAAARDNPEVKFVLIDSRITEGNPPEEVSLPNAKALVFNTAQASYLAGYLAAGMTKTGRVATWGGDQFPPVKLYMDGFVDGVARYNADNDTNVQVLGWNKKTQQGSFAGSFIDQSRGKQLTQGFIAQNADIVLPVAGNAGNGALAAARESGRASVIWVDFDGYETASPEYRSIIMSSVLKHVNNGVYETIDQVVRNQFQTEPYIGSLDNDGVGLAPYHEYDDRVPPELKAKIEELRKQFESGELKVDSPNQP